MRNFTMFALVAVLLIPLTSTAQVKEDSASTSNQWSIGMRLKGSSSYFTPGLTIRRAVSPVDDLGGTIDFHGQLQKRKSFSRTDEGVYEEFSDPIYSGSNLQMMFDWRRFQGERGSIRSFLKLALSLELEGFIDSDNSIDYETGPLVALGYQWKPNEQISLFAEIGGYARYSYDQNTDYNTRQDGSRFIQHRYVYRNFYYGLESSFGLSFYL